MRNYQKTSQLEQFRFERILRNQRKNNLFFNMQKLRFIEFNPPAFIGSILMVGHSVINKHLITFNSSSLIPSTPRPSPSMTRIEKLMPAAYLTPRITFQNALTRSELQQNKKPLNTLIINTSLSTILLHPTPHTIHKP